ncbi:DUF7260 family protein [Haloparvum alkalitolerans]|uniref:DUF7260 family protein n=1 Tax=Haloparvum alkalitolerans TaxID=1042953 RepID=UPI003CFA86E1
MTETADAPTDASGTGDGIAAASDALRVERRKIVDEREAFAAFRDRLERIAAEAVPARGPPLRSRVDPAGRGLRAVKAAYEETVMSVPHFAADYDETYEASVEAEFGADLALILTGQSAFDDRSRRTLIDRTETAIEERSVFLDTLDAEAESLEHGASVVAALREAVADLTDGRHADRDFGALDARRAQVPVLRRKCDALAARRQADLREQRRRMRLPSSFPNVPAYLYAGLDDRYPVLAAVGELGSRLDEARRDLERALARSD